MNNPPTKGDEALALWKEWFEQDGDPVYTDPNDDWVCFFCDTAYPVQNGHDPNCYLRAKTLVRGPLFEGLNIDVDELIKVNAMEQEDNGE